MVSKVLGPPGRRVGQLEGLAGATRGRHRTDFSRFLGFRMPQAACLRIEGENFILKTQAIEWTRKGCAEAMLKLSQVEQLQQNAQDVTKDARGLKESET